MGNLKTRHVTISVKQDITPLIEQYGKYAWILHDKDRDKNGELKDPHYHIFLEFPNPRSLNSIANELDIAPNMVEVVRNKKGILAYLTHENDPDKYQYEHSEIHSNFEVKRADEVVTFVTIHKLLKECDTFDEFLSETLHRGLGGNAATMFSTLRGIWRMRNEDTEEF